MKWRAVRRSGESVDGLPLICGRFDPYSSMSSRASWRRNCESWKIFSFFMLNMAYEFCTVISNKWKNNFLYHFSVLRRHSEKLFCMSTWSTALMFLLYCVIQRGFLIFWPVSLSFFPVSTMIGSRSVVSMCTSLLSIHLSANSSPVVWYACCPFASFPNDGIHFCFSSLFHKLLFSLPIIFRIM